MTLIDKAEALAPCPFCGSPSPRYQMGYGVRCSACNASVPCFGDDFQPWNRRAIPARGVGVKPLVWKEDGPEWTNCFYAITPVGRYEIGPYNNGVFSCHVEPEMRDIGLSFRSPDAAKTAAEADYEASILSALAATDAATTTEKGGDAHARHGVQAPDETSPGVTAGAGALGARPCAEHPNCPPNQTCDHCAGKPAPDAREAARFLLASPDALSTIVDAMLCGANVAEPTPEDAATVGQCLRDALMQITETRT